MVNAHGYSLPWLGEYESPAVSVFPRRGDRLALVAAQRLDGQPGVPQVRLGHGDGRLGQRLGNAVVGPEHLGGAGGVGQGRGGEQGQGDDERRAWM